MFSVTDYVDAEPYLDEIAKQRGIIRRGVDANAFPVPNFSTDDALYYEDGKPRTCGRCQLLLDDNAEAPCGKPGARDDAVWKTITALVSSGDRLELNFVAYLDPLLPLRPPDPEFDRRRAAE